MLDGLRILDLTFYLPGPYATLLLADLGAEVVKIENPAGGDPLRGLGPGGDDPAGSVFFRAVNRGKKSVTLDLKAPEGREVFLGLAAGADAIVEQFRPGVAARLGVDYGSVRPRNPRVTYVSLTGYGQTGPLSSIAGHDLNYMAESGLLSLFIEGGRLPLPPIQIADLNGGNLAAVALLAGMLSARLTGQGSWVDVSMTDGLLSLMGLTASNYLSGGLPPERGNLFLAGGEPPYNVYLAADGRFLAVGALEPRFWTNLCRVLSEHDPDRRPVKDIAASREEAGRVFATATSDEWLARLDGLDVCVAPVRTVAEALSGELVRSRGMVIESGGVRQIGPALAFSGPAAGTDPGAGPGSDPGSDPGSGPGSGPYPAPARPAVAPPAPRLGEHSRPILLSLGLSEAEFEDLVARGITTCA